MRFDSPWWLLALAVLPLVAWLRGRSGRDSAFLYSAVSLVKGITALSRSQAGAFLVKLRWLVLALLVLSLARPQLGSGRAPLRASGIDITVAFDLSGSMLAEDFELKGERVNRVTIAKDVLGSFIDGRPNDRIGLVVFAGRAYIAAPPTLDHDFLRRNLERLDTLREQGTAIGSALGAAVNRLRDLKSKSRIVVLMTDGQNNAGDIPPLTAADAAKALGVKVYTIGVGTHGTAPTPVGIDGAGRKVYRQMAVDIDEDTLREISARTGGKYYRADNTQAMRSIYAEIDRLEKSDMEMPKFAYWDEMMQYLAAPAFAFLLLEIVLANTVWRKLP
ncbi:MAG: VWA domain-containing protein [Verrucomicrobia bacterium]|nr:MAG: VWA domain-containing protein [Verrucomicrobiota bacterium]